MRYGVIKWIEEVDFHLRRLKIQNNHCVTKTHPKGKSPERQTAFKKKRKKKKNAAFTANQTGHGEFPFILVRLSSAKYDVLCFAMCMFLIGSVSLAVLCVCA